MPTIDSPRLTDIVPSGALQGLTLLAVEDSRYAGEALRLMAHRSGARLRRAETIHAADWHLRLYLPDLVLIDIGLPDGSGLSLISALRARQPALPVVAMSGDHELRDTSLDAGAGLFLEKPFPSLARFEERLLTLLPGRKGQMQSDAPITPDPLALCEDLSKAVEMLDQGADPERRLYLAQFLGGIARHTHDGTLARAAAEYRRSNGDTAAYLAGLLRLRLHEAPQPFS